MNKYKKCIDFWDSIFRNESIEIPVNKKIGNEILDYGIAWLCEGANTVLDFGCGNGIMLFFCALNGSKNHIGIDASKEAIINASMRSEKMIDGKYQFINGGVESLSQIEDNSVDAVILSNIVDNLFPDDSLYLLEEIKRILKSTGRILIKLNQHLTREKIEEYKISIIKDNLLDDGLILWNNTTSQWEEILSKFFIIKDFKDIYYKEYDQYNRLFLLEKEVS